MYVVLTMLGLLPLAIGVQILRLHLGEGEQLRRQGERQASSFVTLPAMRGAIYDRSGRTLAVNAARYDLALDPTAAGFSPQVAGMFFDRLSRLTGQPAASYRRRVEQRSSPQFVLLVRNLSEGRKESIESWDIPGLILTPTFARRYNYNQAAAHVLGHVDSDGRGIAGVEMQYDSFLNGEDGRRAVKRDRHGVIKAFVGGLVVDPRHGESIVLTIDLVRQTILEEELARGVREAGAQWGSAVAMDPHTGAILAMASYPTYDPNRAASFPQASRRLHAVTDRLEPGSTFKMVTAVAALEQGVVTPYDTIDTGAGWAVFSGRTMRDTRAYGKLTFEDVIKYSSNVGTARVAERMDAGAFYQFARNLGYGQPTYIDIPGEVSGTLRKTHQWSGTDKTSMSIGYAVDATPLQIVTSYAAFANGGLLVKPHIVAERRDVTGRTVWTAPVDSVRRAFSPATARDLLPAFEKVVEEGTARQAQVPGLRVAGKTGTARKVEGGRYVGGAYRGSFVGFFPAEDPRVVMIVVMDEPRTSGFGGIVSAPVFQRTAQRWLATFPEIADRVSPRQELPTRHAMVMDAEEGRPAAIAANRFAADGLTVPWPEREVAPRIVRAHHPAVGDTAGIGGHVRLTVETGDRADMVMPDLTGMTAREAVFWLASIGVTPRVEGSGLVASQAPAAGSPVESVAVVRLK